MTGVIGSLTIPDDLAASEGDLLRVGSGGVLEAAASGTIGPVLPVGMVGLPGINSPAASAMLTGRIYLCGIIEVGPTARTLGSLTVVTTIAGDGSSVIRLGTVDVTSGECLGKAITSHGSVDGTATAGVLTLSSIGFALAARSRHLVVALTNGETAITPTCYSCAPALPNLDMNQLSYGARQWAPVTASDYPGAMPAAMPSSNILTGVSRGPGISIGVTV